MHSCDPPLEKVLLGKVPTTFDDGMHEPLSAEKSPMADGAIVPSTIRNPAMSGHATKSRPNQPDDLQFATDAIRDARARGDQDAVRRAWIDLGALLGLSSAELAPPSTIKRPRERYT